MEELYEEHKKIIYAVSKGMAGKTGIPFDELQAQANLIFCECANRYPDAQHFDRYLKKSLNWGMYRYARQKWNRDKGQVSEYEFNDSEELDAISSRDSKFQSYDDICEITFEDISRDARKIVELVFNREHISRDAELVRPKLFKKHIFSYLKEQGWRTKRIQSSFNELTELVNAYQVN